MHEAGRSPRADPNPEKRWCLVSGTQGFWRSRVLSEDGVPYRWSIRVPLWCNHLMTPGLSGRFGGASRRKSGPLQPLVMRFLAPGSHFSIHRAYPKSGHFFLHPPAVLPILATVLKTGLSENCCLSMDAAEALPLRKHHSFASDEWKGMY